MKPIPVVTVEAALEAEETNPVNQAVEFSFLWFTVPVWLLHVLLHMSVMIMLRKEQMTMINQLMMMDCIVSILYSSLSTFQQSPFYRGLEVGVYCIAHVGILQSCVMATRLAPLAIGLLR